MSKAGRAYPRSTGRIRRDVLNHGVEAGHAWDRCERRARAHLHAPGFPALVDLIDLFVEAGGQLLLCSACDGTCAPPSARRRDVHVSGLATLLSHTVGGSAVTF